LFAIRGHDHLVAPLTEDIEHELAIHQIVLDQQNVQLPGIPIRGDSVAGINPESGPQVQAAAIPRLAFKPDSAADQLSQARRYAEPEACSTETPRNRAVPLDE